MTIDFKREFLFSASMLFRAIHNGQSSESDTWEESIILLHADSESHALERATVIGKERTFSYTVNDGDVVAIEFVSVERVFKVEDSLTGEGADVFSRHLRGSEARSLLEPFPDS